MSVSLLILVGICVVKYISVCLVKCKYRRDLSDV